MKLRTPSRRLRFVLVVAALVLLVYPFWGNKFSEKGPLLHEHIKSVLDAAIDDVSAHILSTARAEVLPEELAQILDIQSYLACLVREAKWQTMISGPSLVMPKTCSYPSQNASFPDDICQLLLGKRALLVGPETTYFLHSIWLNMAEGRHNRTYTCPGRDYCTFHHICRALSDFQEDLNTHEQVGRKQKMPSDNLLRATNSALLQYTFSTTLYAVSNQSDSAYRFPTIDPGTGVQQTSQYWLRRAHKADIIIFNRSPLPAPASTYRSSQGDWKFASVLCSQQKHFPADVCGLSLSHGLANAALDMTIRNFLPFVLQTIRKVGTDPAMQRSLRIWHGSWFVQSSCARNGLPGNIQLLPDFWSPDNSRDLTTDPWTYLYNAQVYLHDRILPRILPFYGITYLPLTIPILKTSSVSSVSDGTRYPYFVKDCIRRPWPGFSDQLGRAFLAELAALLALSYS